MITRKNLLKTASAFAMVVLMAQPAYSMGAKKEPKEVITNEQMEKMIKESKERERVRTRTRRTKTNTVGQEHHAL